MGAVPATMRESGDVSKSWFDRAEQTVQAAVDEAARQLRQEESGDVSECALWYYRYHSVYVDLHDSEEDAAQAAVWMEEEGQGSVQGVQFPDGRYIDREDWNAYKTYERSLHNSYRSDPGPPPAMREVRLPWANESVSILADLPEWVGR